jgi:hypothetical protein
MKMTEEDKRLLEVVRKLESQKCREMLLFQAQAMVQAQNALREDYGIMGPDMPLFNGLGAGSGGGQPAA